MINRHDMFMVKVAAVMSWEEWQKERRRRQNIRAAIQKSEAKNPKDRQVEQLAGRQYTAGQMGRAGAIGAGIGAVGDAVGSGIREGKAGFVKALKNPRQLGAAAFRGALIGSVVPTLKRKADVSAAERGWF